MSNAAGLLIWGTAALFSLSAHAADAPEPNSTISALEMSRSCSQHSKECLAYLAGVRDWMIATPGTFGRLCNSEIGPDTLATIYESHINQAWIMRTNARDAAVWIFQGMFSCHLQRIAEPGTPGFPTQLR